MSIYGLLIHANQELKISRGLPSKKQALLEHHNKQSLFINH
jgi:hypothetical protein